MSDLPLIDSAILDDMIEAIGLEALRPVVELFVGESRTLSATIAAGAGDPARREAVRRAAHSLKSSAGQLGAAALSEAAAELERAAESGAPLASGAALVARLADGDGVRAHGADERAGLRGSAGAAVLSGSHRSRSSHVAQARPSSSRPSWRQTAASVRSLRER